MSTSDLKPRALTTLVKSLAAEHGFDICRITTPDRIAEAGENLSAFIEQGFHGTMDWLPETQDRRANPLTLWPEVRSFRTISSEILSATLIQMTA